MSGGIRWEWEGRHGELQRSDTGRPVARLHQPAVGDRLLDDDEEPRLVGPLQGGPSGLVQQVEGGLGAGAGVFAIGPEILRVFFYWGGECRDLTPSLPR